MVVPVSRRQPSDGRASRVAVALGALGAVLAAAQLVLIVMSWSHPTIDSWSPRGVALLQTAIGGALAAVGFVIVMKRRANLVGWLLLMGGIAGLGWWLASEYAGWGLVVAPGSLPGAGAAALLSNRLWVLPVGCVTVMLLVFPTGRLLSWAWWPAAVVSVTAMVLVVPSLATVWQLRGLGRVLLGDGSTVKAPAAAEAINLVLAICLGVSLMAAVASVVVRWRRSEGIERLQLKWLVFAAAITLTTGLLDVVSRWARVPMLFALLSVPIAVGVAVLRYRLYDIDRIISRTVSYATLTVLLASVYSAMVTVATMLTPGTRTAPAAVAASTLAAAALFAPARSRIQRAVDRRFDRSRYDAVRVVEDYRTHVRAVVDLDAVSDGLVDAAQRSVHPTTAGVWLRTSRR